MIAGRQSIPLPSPGSNSIEGRGSGEQWRDEAIARKSGGNSPAYLLLE